MRVEDFCALGRMLRQDLNAVVYIQNMLLVPTKSIQPNCLEVQASELPLGPLLGVTQFQNKLNILTVFQFP